MKILLVEDDVSLAEQIKSHLAAQNHVVDLAATAEIAWDLVESCVYNLIVLTGGPGKINGLQFCRQLRSHGYQTLTILLSNQNSTYDKVSGLDAGADEYLVKPIEFSELEARMRALLRRQAPLVSSVLEWGNLRLDPVRGTVSFGTQPVNLTAKEYGLLELLMRNNQRIYSHSAILDQLWSIDDDVPSESSVRSHMRRLRNKLNGVGADDLIETVYGLGYRLNQAFLKAPVESPPEAAAPPAQTVAPTVSPLPTEGVIAEFWRSHHPKLVEQMVRLEQQLLTLAHKPEPDPLKPQILQDCQKLVGSLEMLGFAADTELVKFLKTDLPNALQSTPVPWSQCQQRVALLRRQVEQAPLAKAATPPTMPSLPIDLEMTRLLVLANTAPWINALTAEITLQGWQLAIAPDLAAAQDALSRLRPDALLLDCTIADPSPPLLDWLAQQTPPIPTVGLVRDPQAVSAILALRQAGCQVLAQDAAPPQVLATLARQMHPPTTAAKLLIVDDDRLTLHLLQGLLTPWSLHVSTLNDPRQCLATLEADPPDLLILDIQMPHINGIELCQQLRQHPQWSWLPILVLTGQTDAATIQQVFTVGADDYLSKPIVAPELVTRIFNRLDRSRLVRQQADMDPLTQLPNRSRSQKLLQTWLSEAQLGCFGVLELEHFTRTNRQYGHLQGEKLLRAFAQRLRDGLLGEGVISRWTDAEFVVGLPGMTAPMGADWLVAMRQALANIPFSLPDGHSVSATFRAGVVSAHVAGIETAAEGALQWLYQRASAALDQSKLAGCDRGVQTFVESTPLSTRRAEATGEGYNV